MQPNFIAYRQKMCEISVVENVAPGKYAEVHTRSRDLLPIDKPYTSLYRHSVVTLAELKELRFLRPTRHKIGYFGDIAHATLSSWCGKTKPNTTKAHIQYSKEMYCNCNTK